MNNSKYMSKDKGKIDIIRKILRESSVPDLEDKRQRMDTLRQRNEWELNAKCPVQGLEAHAVLKHLIEDKGIDRDSMDVYDIFPNGEYYRMSEFIIIADNNVFGITYICGDDYDTEESAKESLMDIIDDTGYEGYSSELLEDNIDKYHVRQFIQEYYNEDVWSNPEIYISEEYRQLSPKQQDEINSLKLKIEKLRRTVSIFQNAMSTNPSEKLSENIKSISEDISEFEEEISSIEEYPEGEFPDDMIDERIDQLVREYSQDPVEFLKNIEYPLERFIDKESLVNDIINYDGYTSGIQTYDGDLYETKILNTIYYVGRFD